MTRSTSWRCKRVGAGLALVLLTASTGASADPMLADVAYAWPVSRASVRSQEQAVQMAYLDVPAPQPNGRTVVLLHGKNFCAGSWEAAIRALVGEGYRVVAPDQVGFCKSTKPERYQYGLHTLAANTRALLDQLGVQRPIVLGHSMGGMLAMRYSLQYPQGLSQLVLLNPLGLEDWRAKGVPNTTIDELFAGELKTTAQSIRAYQLATYYAGVRRPEYDRWVEMAASMYGGPGGRITAWHQALTSLQPAGGPRTVPDLRAYGAVPRRAGQHRRRQEPRPGHAGGDAGGLQAAGTRDRVAHSRRDLGDLPGPGPFAPHPGAGPLPCRPAEGAQDALIRAEPAPV